MASTRLASNRPVEAHAYTGFALRVPDEPLRCACVHPASDNVTAIITSLPRVVVDPTVRSDEPLDARLVDTVQDLEAGPRGQRDPARHRRIGREDDLRRILAHDARELVRDVRT